MRLKGEIKMKTNLNELVVEYKKTNNSKILEEIFIKLKRTIHEKAQYVFYHQKFQAKNFKFRLVDTKQVDLEDVEQELNLKILELINSFDVEKEFDKYLYGTLWIWKPRFVNSDFIRNLKNVSSIETDDEGNEFSIIDGIAVLPKQHEEINVNDLFVDLTEQEKILLNILKENPEINQSELSEKIEVTQPRISQLYDSIRKKLKSDL